MCSPVKNEGSKDVSEQARIHTVPKKFVFDFVGNEDKKNESQDQQKKAKNLQLLRYVPVIHGFTQPEDIQEAYESVCDSILDLYGEIRQIFLTDDDMETTKDAIKNLKIESPKGCLDFFKTIALRWHEILKDQSNKCDLQKTIDAYEKLLQKSELKIRDFIRNEHIYRISFDQFAMRNEEAEKVISDLETKLQEKSSTIEALGKEKSKLTFTIQQREEEIRLMKQKKDLLQNSSYNQPKNTPQSDSETPLSSENQKTKNPGLAIKNLKIVLNNNPTLPTEEVYASSNGEYLKVPQIFKKSQNKSQEVKVRPLHKSGTVTDLLPGNVKSLKLSDFEKLRRDGKTSVRSGMQTLTERRKINISGEYNLSNSGKLTEWYSFVKSSKRASSQAGNFYNTTTKVKTPIKAKTKRDRSEDDDRVYSPSKKIYEDSLRMVAQTEPSEEQTRSYLFPERIEKKKLDQEHRSSSTKANKSHIQTASGGTKKRRSGNSKIKFPVTDFTVDITDKTPELKSFVLSVKGPGSNSATQRNGSKGPLIERKENKVTKISPPLMNIMPKKLAEQKLISKK